MIGSKNWFQGNVQYVCGNLSCSKYAKCDIFRPKSYVIRGN